jgi:isoamylase
MEVRLLAFPCETEMTKGFLQGKSFPLGATPFDGGVNFSVFSKNGAGIELLLFDGVTHTQPAQVIPLESKYRQFEPVPRSVRCRQIRGRVRK